MKIFEVIGNWWTRQKEQYATKQMEKSVKELVWTSNVIINIKEMNGVMYISYNNIPVVRIDDLQSTPQDALTHAREAYISWHQNFSRIW